MRVLMEKAIDSGLPVLITGETGAGKELVAKAIHTNSPRKDQPMRELNCGAIPKDLAASMLFGHRKGAFTGADTDRMGLFEDAKGGTVILDEIGEMPNDAQVHLLRVLQERTVIRIGEFAPREVDVRIIAITNRDLEKEVSAGRFRADLYHRLKVFPIPVPPLRERTDDIPLLAEHFLQQASQQQKKEVDGFGSGVFEMLSSYSWPGNIRELENEVHRAVALVEGGMQVQTYHFSSLIHRGESLITEAISEGNGYAESVKRFQRRLIEQILRECGGNRHEAARRLKMHRPNLIDLIKRLGIKERET
jgi:transcriptional regulator with GAF, ATPase, and Fis domain